MEQQFIRLRIESELCNVEGGGIYLFPAKPSEEMIAQINRGELQVVPVPLRGNLAHKVPVYGAGRYTGGLINLTLRSKLEDRQWTAPGVALPEFPITGEDIEQGECRVVLPAVATLKVTVLDNQGRPMTGEKVCVLESGRSMCGESDSAGVFTVQLAVGQYGVTVTDGESQDVELSNNFEEVSLLLRRPGRSCRVLVVDTHGQPFQGCVRIRAVREGEKGQPEAASGPRNRPFMGRGEMHRSACDGSALFAGMEAGTYHFAIYNQPETSVSLDIDDFEPHTITLVTA
jgi:hypothetical protein